MTANKLKEIILNSVDFCFQGANPDADIKIIKSKEGKMDKSEDRFTKLCNRLRKSKFPSEEVALINKAMRDCVESIEKDQSMEGIEKFDMLKENVEDFAKYFADASKEWDSPNLYQTEELEKMGVLNDIIKSIDEVKMDAEDSKILKTILGKYQAGEADSAESGVPLEKKCKTQKTEDEDPEEENPKDEDKKMEKASDDILEKAYSELKKEVEDMKKAQEMNVFKKVAEEYTCIGKKVDELAPLLYELKKADDGGYQTFIDTLNQCKETKLAMNDGILKTYGSDKALPIEKMGDLDATVAQIRKSDPQLSQAEAIVKAYESNPELPEII